jgi:CHAT domain-containing protein
VSRAAVTALVDAFRRAIADGADRPTLQARSAPLLDLLSPGLLDRTSVPRLAIVADGEMFALPFPALVQATGRYLVEDRVLEMASGLGAFIATRGVVRAASVLAIGDGHLPTAALPRLRGADGEAAAVAAEYPAGTSLQGPLASRARVLQGLGRTDVFHFAGHSVANAEHPQYAHLLAAPDGADGGSAVFPADLYRLPLSGTSVVVLASCETAVGRPVLGEGPLSLAKPFLSRGVRFVVASLWPVDDGRAQALTVAFHRTLRTTGDPAAALRAAQLQMIGSPDRASQAARLWGAFSAFSGHGSRS